MFSYMSSTADHIEILESMDTSSCINALRCFFAICKPAKQLGSDCGANFVGARKELKNEQQLLSCLSQQCCTCEFNPLHASHGQIMGAHYRDGSKNPWLHIASLEHTPFSWSLVHSYGGGYSNNECETSLPSIHRPWLIYTNTCNDTHGWDPTFSWRLDRQGGFFYVV